MNYTDKLIMKLFKVSSSQFNYRYGDQIHFPYSISSLVSYIKSKENLSSNFKFEKTFIFRDKIDEYIKLCNETDILICSCYVWNWEITKYLYHYRVECIDQFYP